MRKMTDTKYKEATGFFIGYDLNNKTTILTVIDYKDKQVSPDGQLVSAAAAINDKTIPGVRHHQRYHLVQVVFDGFNYEAFFTQDVVSVGVGKAIQQGADNDPIGYLRATLVKLDDGIDVIDFESGRGMLSGFHLHATNREGTRYQPTTVRFKVRGNRTVNP